MVAPRLVPKSGRLFSESSHVDDSIRLSAIFFGRQTALDNRPCPSWDVAVVKAEILAGGQPVLSRDSRALLLSCYMLEMPWYRTLYFAIAITIMTLTLTGLAVGLGALYPNFKEENPTKIVSGFGGTFCLVLSFLYILGSVVLLALASPWSTASSPSKIQVIACLVGFGLLSFLLGWLPLRLGLRALRSFEL